VARTPGVSFKQGGSAADVMRACDRAKHDTRREMVLTMHRVGEIVRVSAATRALPKHAPTAAGYRTVLQPRGVKVQQSLQRKVPWTRSWGPWQMRHALLPALFFNVGRINREFDEGVVRVIHRFEKR
jgi:hypothetical protein